LVSASITISTYVRYLVALRELYVALEAALADNCDHPALRPIFNPRVLCRVPGLDADIQFYTDMLNSSGGKVSTPPHSSSLPQPLHTYTTYIKNLSVTAPHMLLAHAYVRYLGDMSGGREIRRIIEKHFLRNVSTGVTEDRALDDLGCGLAFYRFEPLEPPAGAPREANATEIRQIKVWFRHGMDVGAGADEAMIHALVDEANRAFEMNSDALKGI
ncbi:heme oxygenase-like protein, partial [Fistulina hepatica ATCC 64428]